MYQLNDVVWNEVDWALLHWCYTIAIALDDGYKLRFDDHYDIWPSCNLL